MYEIESYNNSKIYIDSLKNTFPNEFKKIKQANQLMRRIELKEQERNAAFIETTLEAKNNDAEVISKDFVYEKNEYQVIGQYYIKNDVIEKNTERCYLRMRVDEHGTPELHSIFFGKNNINHTSIKAETNDGTFVQTDIIEYDGGRNYRFSDNGNKSEIVTYKKGADNGVIAFIAANSKERIKITYLGDKKYVMYLDETTKSNIAKYYDFANVLSDVLRLTQEKNIANNKIEYLKKRIEDKEPDTGN